MRPSTLARTGAVATAAALVLSLGTGTANAAESTSSANGVQAEPAAGTHGTFAAGSSKTSGPIRPTAYSITTFRLNSGIITSKDVSGIFGDVFLAGTGTPTGALTTVTIDGKVKGQVPLYPGDNNGGVNLPRTWGSGPVVLGPTTIFYGDQAPSVDTTKSNTFYIRKNIKTTRSDGIALKIRRVNSRITFKAQQVKIINPSTGKYVSAGSVKLQYKSGSTWKTRKTIKLNSKGDGSYSRTTSSKYRYRLYIAKTAKNVDFRTYQSSRI